MRTTKLSASSRIKDIFQAFIELLGHKKQGTRFIFAATDTPGEFAPMAKCFGDNNANLDSLAVYHTKERGAEIVVKASGAISVEDMAQILVNEGFKLKGIVQTTKFGTRTLSSQEKKLNLIPKAGGNWMNFYMPTKVYSEENCVLNHSG